MIFKSVWVIFYLLQWNDKITTLPGLYYLSTSVLRLIALALGENNKNLCTVYNLRLSNLVVSAFNFLVIFKILQKLKIKKPNAKESSDVSEYKSKHKP